MGNVSIPVECADGFYRGRYPLGSCAIPVASPAAGSYVGTQNVTLSCSTIQAQIYFTTDGSTPALLNGIPQGSTQLYQNSITVAAAMTINAISIAQDYQRYGQLTAAYIILPVTVTTASPLPNAIYGVAYTPVQLTASGGTAPYTWAQTGGALPTGLSLSSAGIISGTPSSSGPNSITVQATDAASIASIPVTLALSVLANPAAAPTFLPAPATYGAPQNVTPSSTTPGYSIYYTTDGSTPAYPITGSTQLFTTPIAVGASETINAIAVAPGYTQSAVASAQYVISIPQAATPTFAPGGGTYSSAQTVTVGTITPSGTIYVTQDGTTPTTASPSYPSGQRFAISVSETIQAIATAPGYTQSAVGGATYTIAISSGLGFPISGWFPDTASYSVAAVQQGYARFNYVYGFDGYYGQEASLGMTFEAVISAIQSYSAPLGTKTECATYIKDNEAYTAASLPAGGGNTGYVLLAALTAHPLWWLATAYPTPGPNSNTIFDGGANPQYCTLNSNACPAYNMGTVGQVPGPGTINLIQFWNWVAYMRFCIGTGNSISFGGSNMPYLNASDAATGPNPLLNNNIFHDNQLKGPRNAGNWLATTTSYPSQDQTAGAAMAQGYNQGITLFRNLAPTVKHMGNCDNMNTGFYPPGTQQLYDYPCSEWVGGYWEPAYYQNFGAQLATMKSFAANLARAGGIASDMMEGIGGPSGQTKWGAQSGWGTAEFQGFRYMAAYDTMAGWIALVRGCANSGTSVPWFDEFDAGVGSYNWLGALTVAPYNWTQGVWRADYAGGSILANPWKNGAQTINMPYSGHFISHTANHSDAAYASGNAFTTATTFTLQDRDAIFIKKP